MSDTDYFIQVENPLEMRKELLMSSKSIILTLKEYHSLQGIRKNKLELVEVLKDQIKELTFLLDKLDEKIPDKQIDFEKDIYEEKQKPVEEPKPEVKVEKPEVKPKVEVPKKSEVDKLQDALASIEKKLSSL